MTVSSDVNKITYAGNGSTQVFSVNYYFLADSHLQVVLITTAGVETVQTLTTNYTVTGAGNEAGGSVTMLVAPPTGVSVVIQRVVPATQETDYLANDPFPAESHERALDKLTMLVQQNERENDRSLKIPLSAVPTTSTELPAPVGNKLLAWNSNASAVINFDPADIITIVGQQTSYGDVFTGNGVTTDFTLSRSPGSVFGLDVSINGVTQVPNVDYTLGGTTLTFTSAPPSVASQILARYAEVYEEVSADAQNVRYVPAGAGAVTTNVQTKLRETVSVKDFGAVGDGVTDDTAAIQAAIDAKAAAYGGTVFIPAGSYKCTATIVLKDGVNLVGEGRAHEATYAGGDERGSVLLCTVGAGDDVIEFEGGAKGHYGIYNLTILEEGSAAFNCIINIAGVLHPVLEDVEASCLGTRRGTGLILQPDGGGDLTLYGSFRNLVTHNVIDGIKILEDSNANSFIGGSVNCSRFALVMDGVSSFPTATAFTGMAFEGIYNVADQDVTYFSSPNNIQGYDIYETDGYRFNFVNIVKSVGTMFSGCYFELGGYPNPYNDGVNGSHPSLGAVCVEPATPLDVQSTGFYNCRFSGCFIYDVGTNTRANNLGSVQNYSSEKPSSLALRRSTAQTLTASSWQQIAYDATSLFDDASIRFDTNTTLTFTQSGTYLFIANCGLSATTDTSDYVQMRADANGVLYYGANFPKTSASNLETGATVSGMINVAVGDTLKIELFNASSGGSMTAAANRNELFVVKIA